MSKIIFFLLILLPAHSFTLEIVRDDSDISIQNENEIIDSMPYDDYEANMKRDRETLPQKDTNPDLNPELQGLHPDFCIKYSEIFCLKDE